MDLNMKPKRYVELWKNNQENEEYPVHVIGITGSYLLDPISSLIWRQLDGKRTISDILEDFKRRFTDVDESELKEDLKNVLEKFEQDDLIQLDYNPLNPNKEIHREITAE